MIEYYLHTGIRGTGEKYNNFGNVNNGVGSINSSDVVTNQISINGKTLLETIPLISIVGQIEIITNSGEFFLSGYSIRNETGFYDFNRYSTTNLKFDIVESGEQSFYQDSTFTGLMTGFSGEAGNLNQKTEIFLNGIKLVSGSNYLLNSNNNFVWNDSEGATGTLFTMPYTNQVYNSGNYDVTGNHFNKGTTISYLNGVRVDEEDFLETSQILIPIIELNLNDKLEFNRNPATTRVFL